MFKWILLLFTLPLFALELSVQTGKEEQQNFSTIHLKDTTPFLCEAQKNDFDQTTELICAFKRRPSNELQPLQNSFFTITSQTRGDTYFIIIKPLAKLKLYPMIFELAQDETLFNSRVKMSKHWMVLGYRETLPLFKEDATPPQGINLPITLPRDSTPFVGGLDVKGNPVHLSRVQDVTDYIAIKRLYKSGNYAETLELVNQALENGKGNVFNSELLLYQIRCSFHLDEAENTIESAKKFIRLYSYDESMPEVLAYTAHAYGRIGQTGDSDYFFERLFSEHKSNRFAQLGLIYKAELMESSGNAKKALQFYEKAYLQTTDVAIASEAAFKMARYYAEHGKMEKAEQYVDKVLKGNAAYFAEHTAESETLAMTFAERGRKLPVGKIAGAILEGLVPRSEKYEEMLKNQGVWLAETELKDEALAVLNHYLKDYLAGDYIEEVQMSKDALFFEDTDQNVTTRLAEYDSLIERYGGDSIGDKAIYKKAELLYESGQYRDVLDMNDTLALLDEITYPEVNTVLDNAALKLMERSLEEKACSNVIALSNTYNVTLSAEKDDELYECALQVGNYTLAKKVASPYITSKEMGERMKWLYRYIETDFATGNYTNVIDAAKELIALIGIEETKRYDNIYRIAYDAHQRLGNSEEMITAIKRIETAFGVAHADVERFTQMVTLGQREKDELLIENYASKVMTLQEKSKSYTQSPYIEFTLYDALVKLNKEAKALKVLTSLDARELTTEKRARQKYLMGALLQKAKKMDAAKTAFEQSKEADAESAWGKLAADALALLN